MPNITIVNCNTLTDDFQQMLFKHIRLVVKKCLILSDSAFGKQHAQW